MTTKQKLTVIQKRLDLTQTKLAEKFGVSFVAFNNWWNEKSAPRPKAQTLIDELFLEVTGKKIIAAEVLKEKNQSLQKASAKHKNILKEILSHQDIREQFILKLTYHSNSIEGSTLTEPETAAIIFDNVALPDKTLTEQLEAKNHQAALNYLFTYLSEGKKINEALILKLHSILMNGVRPDAGNYRRHAVRILGVNLPTANYLRIPNLMPEVATLAAKKTKETIKDCAAVHSRFEQIHPFSDGNGRVGRLLMTAMLLQANLPPAVIDQNKKQFYYVYLLKAQTGDDQSQLENFLYDAAFEGLKILERTDIL